MKDAIWSVTKVQLPKRKVKDQDSYVRLGNPDSTISILSHAGIGGSWDHNVMAFKESRIPLRFFTCKEDFGDIDLSGSFFRYRPKKNTVFESFFDVKKMILVFGSERLHLNPPTLEEVSKCHNM